MKTAGRNRDSFDPHAPDQSDDVTWDTLDWPALDRLRERFLAGKPGDGSYWRSRRDLANYDFTFGQRIGWKWEAVLRELKARGWQPPPGPLLDWACGSGIAGRRVLEAFGAVTFGCLGVLDHSTVAMDFAAEKARSAFPGLAIEPFDPGRLPVSTGTLVISHVLNELDDGGREALRSVLARAQAVLWVEPGTHADSRTLIDFREEWREQFLVIAPCTHQAQCGLLVPDNQRHWCHTFARPPGNLMANSNWVRFAQRAGFDLRSLPYSFLVLERRGLRQPAPGMLAPGWGRIIGRPRTYKGFAKLLTCQANGVNEREWQKRAAPKLFKQFKEDTSAHLWQWRIEDDRIVAGTSLEEKPGR